MRFARLRRHSGHAVWRIWRGEAPAACPGDTILTGNPVTDAPAREAALQSDVVAGVAAGLAGVGLGAGEVVV